MLILYFCIFQGGFSSKISSSCFCHYCYRNCVLQYVALLEIYFKGTVMQTEKALINGCSRVSKVS